MNPQKTNLDFSQQLETMKHRSEELTSQIEILKAQNGKACDNSKKHRSFAAHLVSGEQFTLNVPTSVCPDDIMQATREYLCSLGKGPDPDFEVLQGDQDIYDVDGSEECKLFGPLTVVMEASAESDCGEDGDQNFYASLWGGFDGAGQTNDAPAGTYQSCYWTDGMCICMVKQSDGAWKYSAHDD